MTSVNLLLEDALLEIVMIPGERGSIAKKLLLCLEGVQIKDIEV